MNLQILYVWVNGGLYDANSSTYSVLWTPPVLAWLKTCVSALGFNMINDDFFKFLQMMRMFLLLLLSHVESHDKFLHGCVVFFNWSTTRSWTLKHDKVTMAERKKVSEDCVEYRIFPALNGIDDHQTLLHALDTCLALVSPHVVDHIWHNDPFQLTPVDGRIHCTHCYCWQGLLSSIHCKVFDKVIML